MFKLGHINPTTTPSSSIKFHIETNRLGGSNKLGSDIYPYYYAKCGINRDLCTDCSVIILFKNVCKNCLRGCTHKEIEELKFWLVLRKLKK